MLTEHEIQEIADCAEIVSESNIRAIAAELVNLRQNNRHLATQCRCESVLNKNLTLTMRELYGHIDNLTAFWRVCTVALFGIGLVAGYAIGVMQ